MSIATIVKKVFFLILLSSQVFGQLYIQFPVERAVFQRNNSNLGFVNIFGNVNQECDRIEARLVARVTGQGTTTNWITIDSKVASQSYSGKLQASGGWYRLQVRGVKNEIILFESEVERVGIGEVFVIAGQSNAQGFGTSPNAKGAEDDRVNAYQPNYFQGNDKYVNLPEYLKDVSFTKVNANTNIGPGGYTAWCYGELGDLLVSRLNVPVMFFNTGYGGTSSTNWRESAAGQTTYWQYDSGQAFDYGFPYKTLGVTLQSINSLLGIRSVLWHQGEFDGEAQVSSLQYYNNVEYVINKTREDIGFNIPWVIARASIYFGAINNNIIEGQNLLIRNKASVWAGPFTDDIQPNRYDFGHFQNIPGSMGLSQVAQRWNESLNTDFFSNSVPVVAQDILYLKHYCLDQTNVRLTVDGSFSSYYWGNGSRSSQIDVNGGFHSLVAKDRTGFRYSNALVVNDVYPQVVPAVLTPEGLTGCVGKTLPLEVASSKYEVNWNTGGVNNAIFVNNSGVYTARFKTEQNCFSQASNSVNVNFVAPPSKPQFYFVGSDGTACEGQSIFVEVANSSGHSVNWSNGLTSNRISVNGYLDGNLNVTLYSTPTCASVASDNVSYTFYDTPLKPEITHSGPFFLKAESAGADNYYEWTVNGQAYPNELDQFRQILESGVYKARALRSYVKSSGAILTCASVDSDEMPATESESNSGFSVFPNPVLGGIVALTSNGVKENVEVALFDMLGRQIYQTKLERLSQPVFLNFGGFQLAGKYFINIKYNAQTKTFPVVFVK